MTTSSNSSPSFIQALIAGGVAGTSVDTILFPLDTIKTRLQSQQGFVKAGGFKGVYNGLSSAVIGSAPSAALFFSTYETVKALLKDSSMSAPFVHMTAASSGEIAACLARVPTEVIKQRMQTNQYNSVVSAVTNIFRQEGAFGFYRGYLTTIIRDVPFACIQFPLYEYLKLKWSQNFKNNQPLSPYQAALCGSLSGGITAAITTPLDVAKTRIMLSSKQIEGTSRPYVGFVSTLSRIAAEEGFGALFKGIVPRVMWLSIGGSIFLGAYEMAISLIHQQPTNNIGMEAKLQH